MTETQTDRFDPSLRDLISILWQRRGVVALSFVSVFVGLLIMIGNWQSDYRAVAEIGLSDASALPVDGANGSTALRQNPLTAQMIETVIAEIKGEEILATALAVLRGEGVLLSPKPSEGGLTQLVRSVLGAAKTPIAEPAEQRGVNQLRGGLDASRIGNAAVIEIGFTAYDPDVSQAVLRAVVESYVWEREDRQKRVMRGQLAEAIVQFETAQNELNVHESDLAQWQLQAGVLNADESKMMLDRIYALDEQAEKLSQELTSIRMAARSRNQASGLQDLLTIPDVANHRVVAQLITQFDAKKQEFATLDQRYGPKHPLMQGKSRELDELRGALAKLANDVADQLNLNLAGAQEQLRLVTRQRDDWQSRMADRHARLQGQAALLRSVAMTRQNVQELGLHVQTIRRELASFRGDVEILRSPTAPTQSEFPGKHDLILMAIMVAIFAAVGVGLLRHYFDQTIGNDFEPESRLGIPLYARIPDLGGGGMAGDEAIGHLAVLMRILNQNALKQSKEEGASHNTSQVIAIGSAAPGDGKSHLARALADKLSAMGGSVVLLDADLHDPGPVSVFENQQGIVDLTAVLSGDGKIEDALWPQGNGVHYIGARMAVPGTIATSLIETKLGGVIADLRTRFSHIIIDTPPILSIADGVVALRSSDVKLMAVRCGHSKRDDIIHALDQLRTAGITPDGVILNSARPRVAYGKAGSERQVAGQVS
ncbi:MAG: hypothetical protein RIB30_08200 [Thalassospira sp.]|uniref:GumC family protein n=1 Tax=Thalassospira sp. TaxID=1912094 RepID=UPI0032F08C5D